MFIAPKLVRSAGPKHFSTTDRLYWPKDDCCMTKTFEKDCPPREVGCPKTTERKKPAAKPKKPKEEEDVGFFASFFGGGKKKKPPPGESCRLMEHQRKCQYVEELPDFVKKLKGPNTTVQRTEGRAFILDSPSVSPVTKRRITKEELLVNKLEADKATRRLEEPCNPMPEFTTVGQRWIDLQSRKLHPFYKKYEMPVYKRCTQFADQYYKITKSVSNIDELPNKLSAVIPKREKVVFAEFKQTELPQQLVKRMKELEMNMQSNFETKFFDKKVCKEKGPKHAMVCEETKCDKK